MELHAWLTFAVLMTAIAYTPGPMTMFAMSSSVRRGFARTLPAILGGSVAYLTQMIIVYFGLGVVVQSSLVVFNAIKWTGVAYLLVLGIRNWRMAGQDAEQLHEAAEVSTFRLVSLGYATGMSNPKSVLVFTVLFPQFIDPAVYTEHFCILAASFFLIQGSSAVAYALFGARVFRWLRQRALTHVQHKVTAIILFIAGGMLATSER